MHGVEFKIMNNKANYLAALKTGQEKALTRDEMEEIAMGGDTYSWFDFDKLRFNISKLGLEKGWLSDHSDMDVFHDIIKHSGNEYIPEFLIALILVKNPDAAKPDYLKESEYLSNYHGTSETFQKLSTHWDLCRENARNWPTTFSESSNIVEAELSVADKLNQLSREEASSQTEDELEADTAIRFQK